MQKTRPAEKLEWIVSELGEGADLLDFARKYRELFGEKTQKANCLDLYRQYANIAKTEECGPYPTLADARKLSYSMECQVPPEELEAFQKLWDKDAPRRCHENSCELPADAPLGQHFCAEHANAGKTITCAYVVEREVVDMGSRALHDVFNASPCESHEEAIVRRCNGEVIMVEGCRVCKKCGQGSAIAKTVAAAGQEDTNLDKSLKRSAESLRIANNVWGSFSINVDPDHVPAWTKRRRL